MGTKLGKLGTKLGNGMGPKLGNGMGTKLEKSGTIQMVWVLNKWYGY